MSTILEFGLLGLGVGGLYALMALGLIVVYRSSGTINFAQGAIGMVGTYFYWQFHEADGWSFFQAFPLSIAISGGIGAVAYLLVMRPLRNSTSVARLLGTLGILITLESAVSLKFPESVLFVPSSLPLRGVRIFGTTVSEAQLWLFALAVVLTLALGLVYRHTRFGLATTAVAENRRAASALGYSPGKLACANWIIGSVLAGTAGIMLAPITGLSVSEYTALIVPALAAAVVGNMTSFSITLAAGLVIGVLQSEMTRYVSAPGWPDALPFFIVIVVLALRGSSLPRRGESASRLPRVGTGKVRLVPAGIVVAGLIVCILIGTTSWVDAITVTLSTALVLLSVVVVTGYAGQLSLCQFSLAGVGAFIAGRAVAAWHVPFPVALLFAMAVAIPIGFVVGLPSLRSRGSNLAIATICLAVGLEALVFDSGPLTGGGAGTNIGSPSFFGINMNSTADPIGYALVALGFAIAAALLVANLRRSKSGRWFLAVRANERAASTLGVGVTRVKLQAFMLGSVLASLGGVLYGFMNSPVVYTTFDWLSSVNITGLAVIGGLGSNAGPYFGAQLQPGALGTSVGYLFGANIQTYLTLAGGVLLITMLIQAPNGMADKVGGQVSFLLRKLRTLLGHKLPSESRQILTEENEKRRSMASSADATREAVTLSVENVSVNFGGTVALDRVSINLNGGEIVGIIGPNGAGKTTLIDAIMGFVPQRGGRISLNGVDIGRLRPDRRAAMGIGMTFQSLELFEDMTVLENLLVAAESRTGNTFVRDLVRPGHANGTKDMWTVIEEFELLEDLDRPVRELAYGRRRLVAVARAAARTPDVLLLDEPVAGLRDAEANDLQQALRATARLGVAVALVEHDVGFVMSVCDRVVVLNFGKMITEGLPEMVRANPDVISAYLGSGAISFSETSQ